MTREDIIRMAREAGIDWHKHWNDDESNRLERFAALVAADEREACADIARKVGTNTETEDFALDKCYEIEAAIRAREKELANQLSKKESA